MPGDIIDTAIDQWRKPLRACVRANGGHFKHFLLINSCKQFAFSCILVQVASAHGVIFYCVDTWWSIGLSLPFVTAKLEQWTNKQ